MKKLAAALVAIVLALGTSGAVLAETQPAEKKMDDKKAPAMKAKSASGVVKSASADGVVVSGKNKGKEAEWTFAVDKSTKIRRAGKDIPAADLKAGDSVQVRYSEHDGKVMAQSIMVRGTAMTNKPEKAAANPCAAKPAEKK